MAPTAPDRDESFYTVEGQLQIIGVALAEHQAGIRLPQVILDDDGGVVGRATVCGASGCCSSQPLVVP
jgi:ribosomal-protein-alanine N-acetyltransferase